MSLRSRLFAALLTALVLPFPALLAQEPAAKKAEPDDVKTTDAKKAEPEKDPIALIKEEGSERSEVMKTLSYLSDVIGPRLTASPQMKRANEWTRDKMGEWGLENAHLEAWGPFGRGWSLKRFSAQVVEPQCVPLIGYPKAWSPGTDGPVTGEVVVFKATKEEDLEQYKGKLKGAIVLTGATREPKAWFDPPGERFSDTRLLEMANAPEPRPRASGKRASRRDLVGRPAGGPSPFAFQQKRAQFLIDEGAVAIVEPSPRGDGGTLFVQSANVPSSPERRARPWDKDAPKILPQVVLAVEHFNRLVRMAEAGEPLKMTVDVDVAFHDEDLMGYNTVAEIPGSDLKDEIVMLGGHMDSWHSGTGATDNAAGVAVCMEAVRILKALDLKPRRTIRVALWSGEEQGLFGSRAYVREHFGGVEGEDPNTFNFLGGSGGPIKTKPEYEKLSVYFNLDNGTGKIRGVYLEGNEAVRPIFRKWLAPFRDMGAATLTISPTFGTDHQPFDGIGLPAFQFIQDPVEYETRTHHSNMDVYDRVQADDMKQASVIMAAFLYNAANEDEKLPRKPMPGVTKPEKTEAAAAAE